MITKALVDDKYVSIAVTGNLFSSKEGVSILHETEDQDMRCTQARNRVKIINHVDYIVPGHGTMFKTDDNMREQIKNQNKIAELSAKLAKCDANAGVV